jgi:hypothetical protein
MTDEIVKPSLDGSAEVCPAAPASTPGTAPETSESLDATELTEPKKKNALEIPIKQMSPEELRKYNLNKTNKSRAKKTAQKFVSASTQEPSKPEAKKILEARGLTNTHVIDVCYDRLLQAAEIHAVTPNNYLFQNGIRNVLEIKAANAERLFVKRKIAPLNTIPDEPVPGELLNCAELYAIYDVSGEEGTFEQFLQVRQNCKRDCFYLGKEILDKDFAECHRVWTDFFPKFDPSTLPPNYTQKQAISWLDSQSEKKDFLLIASRNSFKSSWSHIWLLSLILCLPDIRVLLVSETRPLSKDFIGAIRSYFETIKNSETRFQRIFAEYTIPMGDGSVLSLDCPMAHLRLPQSIESTSMDSAVAGRRADVILFDDPISSTSCGNEVQCAASVSKYDALRKLREVGGLVAVLGTPWRADIDLYATLLRRNEEDEDKPLKFRIDPAWTLKPEYELNEGKPRQIRDIEEEMVVLLFPERLTWKFLRSEMRSNLAFFASQNLCIFPTDADADIRCTFDETTLKEHVKPISFFQNDLVAKVVLSVDTAFSTAMTADYSCLTTFKILKHEGQNIAVVYDVDMNRWPYSDLAIHIVMAIDKYRPTEVVVEKDRTWQTLQREIIKAAVLRNVVLPHIYWKEASTGASSPKSKSMRVKALEPLLKNDQLYFVQAHWTDVCLDQLKKFDGVTKSGTSRKDDFPDSLAMGIQVHFPFNDGAKVYEKSEEQLAIEAAQLEDQKRRDMYKRYFGSETTYQRQEPEPEEENTNPLFRGNGIALRRRN